MDCLLVTPRDHLSFLYPRFYVSTAVEPLEESAHSDNAPKATSNSINQTPQHSSQERGKCQVPSTKKVSEERHERCASVPVKIIPRERLQPFDYNPYKNRAHHELQTMRLDHLRNTLSFKEAPKVGRALTIAEGRQKHKAGRAVGNIYLKVKDSWSYDWRVPLGLLLQHYQPDSNEPGRQKSHPFRGIMSKQQRTEDKNGYSEIHADLIPCPDIWSPLAFLCYVEDLTSSSVSRTMHHHIYGAHESHVAAIARILEDLFNDPSLTENLTVRAFDTACGFLVKHSLIPTTRVLFSRMDELGLSSNAGAFNGLLRGAASRKDLHNFTFFLQAMIRRGVKPNGETWIALLMAIQTRAVKLLIVGAMKERGILDRTNTLIDAVNQIIEDELVAHLESGQEITAFLDLMDRDYGSEWLSVSAANRMLEELGGRGLLLQCVDVLSFMEQRGIKPNSVTLNTLLGHCSRQRDLDGAIRVLRIFDSLFAIYPKKDHFHQLFMLAWKKQLLNCCRVLWRYACMAAAVSFFTQELVVNSLARSMSSQRKSMAQAWRCTVGKCIVGVGHGDGSPDSALRLNKVRKLVTMAETASPASAHPGSTKLARRAVTKDLAAAKHYRPKCLLADKLEDALAMDRRWFREGTWKESSTMWKVENGIDVPVKRKSRRRTSHRRGNSAAYYVKTH